MNKTLHKLASPLLYKSGLYAKAWRARHRQQAFGFVLTYHRVVADASLPVDGFEIERGISATEFEQQMHFLLRHFTAVKASQIQSAVSGNICFAVTLDDGYEDNYRVAAPILQKLGIPATFYVVSDFVGSQRLFWWEQLAELMRHSSQAELDLSAAAPELDLQGQTESLPLQNPRQRDLAYGRLCSLIRQGLHADIPMQMQALAEYFETPLRQEGRRYGLMDWGQLRELDRQGFEIGGHTATHSNLVGADIGLLQRELTASLQQIESRLDKPVESFAYPYGIFRSNDGSVTELLAASNCRAAFTTVQSVISADSPRFELPRTCLNRRYDFACAFNLQDTLDHSLLRAGAQA